MAEAAAPAVCPAVPAYMSRGTEGWFLLVRVQPGAKKSEFAGVSDGRLRIRLAAPAVENKANKALVSFVAKALGLREAKVRLVSGETGRQKRLLIATESPPDVSLLTPELRRPLPEA